MMVEIKVSESHKIEHFLKKQYIQLIILSSIVSGITTMLLISFAPQIITYLDGTEKTVMILRLASFGNIFIALHSANLMFIVFLNKIKPLVYLSSVSVSITVIGGVFLGKFGYENIIIAYLISAIFSFIVSSIYVRKIMRYASSTYFAKYV
jgi:O-antigen/teichoic acid export membrane protein